VTPEQIETLRSTINKLMQPVLEEVTRLRELVYLSYMEGFTDSRGKGKDLRYSTANLERLWGESIASEALDSSTLAKSIMAEIKGTHLDG
jgi:hypothetical protein